MFPTRPLILASKSPRRSQLLREAGFDFHRSDSSDVDEDPSQPDMPVEDVAAWLARRKALAAATLDSRTGKLSFRPTRW
jgi:septum formation protein